MMPDSRAWLRHVLRPLGRPFREVLAMSLFANLLALMVPVFVLQVYDRVVVHAGLTTLQALLLGMAIVVVFDFVLRQSRARLLQGMALRVDVGIGRRLFDKIVALPLRTIEQRPASFWQALFRDVETVRNALSGATALLLADLPFILVFLALVVVIAEPLIWTLVAALAALVALAGLNAWTVGRALAAERRESLERDRLVGEFAAGRAAVKALALDASLRPEWEERHAAAIEAALARGRRADGFVNLGSTLSILTTIALTAVGALAILDQRMTIGALVAANILAGRFVGPVVQLVANWRTYSGFRDSARRLGEVFALAEERTTSALELPRPSGRLALENVSFGYGVEDNPVINGVTFRLGPGGVHAIVGRNGSGKTTLLKLMQGLYGPTAGRVLIDDGDLSQFTRAQLAAAIGYVPQECFLFSGTIRDNIAKAVPEASDEAVLAAAQAAGVHRYVIDLTDGYATEIGEAGSRLSGGQRQRIAIARALLRDPPVLLLDEPSGNLDRQAEEELRDQLVRLGRDHTVVVVTHSPAILAASDSIMALQNGRIALAGRPDQVLPKLFAAPAQPKAAG